MPLTKKMILLSGMFLLILWSVGIMALPPFPHLKHDSFYMPPDSNWYKEANQRIEQIRKNWITIEVVDSTGTPLQGAEITLRMKRHAFFFGSAVSAYWLLRPDEDGEQYRQTVLRLFNKVTLENDLKWGPWLANTSMYNRNQTFAALRWLQYHHLPVRGHYLALGYARSKDPVQYDPQHPENYRRAVLNHLRQKFKATNELIVEWDAINHIARNHPARLDRLYGPEFWLELLETADSLRQPGQRLFVNEGRILINDPQNRRQAYYEIIRYLLEHKAPLDGIGMMGHFTPTTLTPPQQLWNILDTFAQFGLPILITEFDVRFGHRGQFLKLSKDQETLQATYTRDFLIAMFSHPAVEGVILWGFWEGRHWYPSAALFRKDWTPKPNGQVWEDLVFREWWTHYTGKTDEKGQVRLRGFKGTYTLTVRYKATVVRDTLTLNNSPVYRRVTFSGINR